MIYNPVEFWRWHPFSEEIQKRDPSEFDDKLVLFVQTDESLFWFVVLLVQVSTPMQQFRICLLVAISMIGWRAKPQDPIPGKKIESSYFSGKNIYWYKDIMIKYRLLWDQNFELHVLPNAFTEAWKQCFHNYCNRHIHTCLTEPHFLASTWESPALIYGVLKVRVIFRVLDICLFVGMVGANIILYAKLDKAKVKFPN